MNAKQYSEALVRKDARIAALEAENERLTCCGNCAHSEYDGSWFGCDLNPVDDEGNDDMHPATNRCPLSPSQWEPQS